MTENNNQKNPNSVSTLDDPIIKIRSDYNYLFKGNTEEYKTKVMEEATKLKNELEILDEELKYLNDDTLELQNNYTIDEVEAILSEVKVRENITIAILSKKKNIEDQLYFINKELYILNASSLDITHKINENIDELEFINRKVFNSYYDIRELNKDIIKIKNKNEKLWNKMMNLVFDSKEKQD